MRLAVVVLALLLASAWSCGGWSEDATLPDATAVPGWSLHGTAREYSPHALYEYIDGAADLYLSYGFVGLATADYVRGSQEHLLTVDLYDMGETINAFGIFTSERPREVTKLDLGNQGYSGDGVIAFWQGRQYVKVLQISGDDPADAMALARAVSASLPACSGLPKEFANLPTAHRLPDSERYLRQSALGHKFLENVVSAEYRLGKTGAAMHLAMLASPDKAKQAWRRLWGFESRTGKYLAPLAGLGDEALVVRDPSLGLLLAVRKGPHLLLATSETAPRPALAELVRDAIASVSEESPAAKPTCESAPG